MGSLGMSVCVVRASAQSMRYRVCSWCGVASLCGRAAGSASRAVGCGALMPHCLFYWRREWERTARSLQGRVCCLSLLY